MSLQRREQVAAEEHEYQQHHEGDRAFAQHDARPARALDRRKRGDEDRDVAEGSVTSSSRMKVWRKVSVMARVGFRLRGTGEPWVA